MNFGKTKEEAESVARYSAKLVGISEEILEKSPFNLSGGQMRRVAIAGILASNPDILILDEPTVGLDPKGKLEIIELLKKIQKENNSKFPIKILHSLFEKYNYSDPELTEIIIKYLIMYLSHSCRSSALTAFSNRLFARSSS